MLHFFFFFYLKASLRGSKESHNYTKTELFFGTWSGAKKQLSDKVPQDVNNTNKQWWWIKCHHLIWFAQYQAECLFFGWPHKYIKDSRPEPLMQGHISVLHDRICYFPANKFFSRSWIKYIAGADIWWLSFKRNRFHAKFYRIGDILLLL